MKALVFIPLLVMGLNIGGSAQTTINLPTAQNCTPAGAADTDSDGIPDSRDACPSVAGVWALNGCPLPAGTSAQGYSFACDHAGTAIVDVTLSDGSVWMDRNMGALRAATDDIDLFGAGCLYQYGRKPDGHQLTHYFQPPNWLNGFPTAANVLSVVSGSGTIDRANGYNIQPEVGSVPNIGLFNQAYMGASGTPASTYNQTSGSAASLAPQAPTDVAIPARTMLSTTNFPTYSNYSWWANLTTYPLIDWAPKLWGGNVGNNTAILQAWGTELNPVCPTGYHVPTQAEWYSALLSIYVTDVYRGQWGKSKLHLVNALNTPSSSGDGPAYWTSTQQATGNTYSTVNMSTNTSSTDNDDILVSSQSVHSGTGLWVTGYGIPYSLFVRCKKN